MSSFSSSDFKVTPDEEMLFSTLRQGVKEENLGTVIRVAGGWVRDRFLGYQGKNDIDLALDNMLGSQLADVLVAWNEKQGLPPLHYHVVQLNPEKSKHLETATMKLGKFDVDFVNLRSESYSEDSRIPAMKFGSPLEDALRRDLTINSLFYNINTQEVEDLTGQGVQDLKDGIIRTPLPAMQTLLDDPLRAFRAVRFASRFHFRVDPELRRAIKHPDVHSQLQHKVSRERISQEVLQMLSHPVSSTAAAILLYRLDLLPLVLTTPFEEVDNIIIPAERQQLNTLKESGNGTDSRCEDELVPSLYHTKGLNLYLLMKMFLRAQSKHDSGGEFDGSHTRLVYGDDFHSIEANSAVRYAALMDHGRDVMYQFLLTQKKRVTFRPMPLTFYICMHQLFIGKKTTDTVCSLQQGAASLYSQLKQLDPAVPLQSGAIATEGITTPSYGPFDRVSLGMQLRHWGTDFSSILLLTCAKLSLDSFVKRVEESSLVEGMVATDVTLTRHAAAQHVIQAFLQVSAGVCDSGAHNEQQQLAERGEEGIASGSGVQLEFELETGLELGVEARGELAGWLEEALQRGTQGGGVLLDAVSSLGLEEEWRRPLLLSGKELKQEVLTRIPHGPVFTEVVAKQIQYELSYPNISKSDLAEYLKCQYQDFV